MTLRNYTEASGTRSARVLVDLQEWRDRYEAHLNVEQGEPLTHQPRLPKPVAQMREAGIASALRDYCRPHDIDPTNLIANAIADYRAGMSAATAIESARNLIRRIANV